mgnify:CR=1 FL=1
MSRSLGATANNFARESFMDELASTAAANPLAFRLAQLDNPCIRTVLEVAAKHFAWPARRKRVTPEIEFPGIDAVRSALERESV